MRGKAYICMKFCGEDRITPAHAGKRADENAFCDMDQDHPRTCGEKILLKSFCHSLLGSPPHMRGKDVMISPELDSGRITPAHAGKRFYSEKPENFEKDHPRTCGEKIVVIFF